MTKELWYAGGFQDRFKLLIANPIFKEAILVIYGEVMAHQISEPDINANALQNKFREGAVWGLAQLQMLAVTPIPRELRKVPKPWEHEHKEKLPPPIEEMIPEDE